MSSEVVEMNSTSDPHNSTPVASVATCPVCKGSGWKENRDDCWKSKPCPTCKGSGNHTGLSLIAGKEDDCE